jgi:hypothetical protein
MRVFEDYSYEVASDICKPIPLARKRTECIRILANAFMHGLEELHRTGTFTDEEFRILGEEVKKIMAEKMKTTLAVVR